MLSSSNQVDRDVDIAACRLGVGAGLVCGINQSPGGLTIEPRQGDIQTGLQDIAALAMAQVDLGIDRGLGGHRDLALARRQPDRADEAGRPAGREQLLGIGSTARRARR